MKQSDQDEGVHEITAMSWKLGGDSTERSFTKVYIAEVALSLISLSALLKLKPRQKTLSEMFQPFRVRTVATLDKPSQQ